MCPFCFATVGLVVAGTVSTGGLAALAVTLSRKKNRAPAETASHTNEWTDENANTHSR